jgi:hypothetical protein
LNPRGAGTLRHESRESRMEVILRMARRARTRLMLGRFRQLAIDHAAAAFATATVAAWIFRPGAMGVMEMYAVAAAAALVTAAVHARVVRPSLRTAALALDRASRLRERLSTALLVQGSMTPADRAVVEDAMRIAASADPAQIPLGSTRRAGWPLVPPLLFLASLALPAFLPEGGPVPTLDARASIPIPAPLRKEESAGLRRRAFELERAAGERDLPELKDLAQAMREISEELRRSEMTQAEALSKLSRLEDKARERRKELEKEAGLQDPRVRSGEGGNASAAADEAARRAEELDKKAEELKKKLEKAKEELGKAGPEGATPEMRAAIAELARQLEGLEGLGGQDLGELGKQLEEAAGEADPKALEEMLKSLEGELGELEGLLEGMGMLEGELEELQAMKGRVTGEGKACLFCGKRGEG